jgi:carboxymethylenebutenolidase
VLIHDWYGRLPWLERQAAQLARSGFRVAVPDLYAGVATTSASEAKELMSSLDVAASLAELDEIIAVARAQGSRRMGTVGFSMGGWLALLHAQGGSVDAVVAYYATLSPKDHGVVPCPVLLQFAGTDQWADDEEPDDFIERLTDHGTPVIRNDYANTVHSFANASIPATYNEPAAEDAAKRTSMFLKDYLIG